MPFPDLRPALRFGRAAIAFGRRTIPSVADFLCYLGLSLFLTGVACVAGVWS